MVIAAILYIIQHQRSFGIAMDPVASVYYLSQLLFIAQEIHLQRIRVSLSVFHVSQILRYLLVEYESSNGRFHQFAAGIILIRIHPHLYPGVKTYHTCLICHQHLGQICEHFAIALLGR